MNWAIRDVHIDLIKAGDTVVHEGVMKTVTKGVISYDSFMGKALWGDSYQLGRLPVKKADIKDCD